jgi:hypothetical protein
MDELLGLSRQFELSCTYVVWLDRAMIGEEPLMYQVFLVNLRYLNHSKHSYIVTAEFFPICLKNAETRGSAVLFVSYWLDACFMQPMRTSGDMAINSLSGFPLFLRYFSKCLHYSVCIKPQGPQYYLGFS